MFRQLTRTACAASLLALASFSAQAVETFFGEDLVAGNAGAARPLSQAANAAFLARLGSSRTENFDTFAVGNAAGLTVNLGSAGTATLSGNVDITSSTGAGRFATSGSRYVETQSGFTISFSQPQTAFGFNATDVGDFNGQLSITYASGATQTVMVPHSLGTSFDGSVFFFGLVDSANPFTSVVFVNTDATDFFGFDDLVAGLSLPSILTSSLPAAQADAVYPALQLASEGGWAPITWTASGLPPGMTVSSTGLLSGTATVAGTFTVNLTVTDASAPTNQTANASLPLVVNAAPLVITSDSLPTGTAGTPYSAPVQATGGQLPLMWSATGLPAGLAIDPSTGLISGTALTASPATVMVTVADSSPTVLTTTQSLSLTINAAPVVVEATVMPVPTLGEWALGLLGVLTAIVGAGRFRARRS